MRALLSLYLATACQAPTNGTADTAKLNDTADSTDFDSANPEEQNTPLGPDRTQVLEADLGKALNDAHIAVLNNEACPPLTNKDDDPSATEECKNILADHPNHVATTFNKGGLTGKELSEGQGTMGVIIVKNEDAAILCITQGDPDELISRMETWTLKQQLNEAPNTVCIQASCENSSNPSCEVSRWTIDINGEKSQNDQASLHFQHSPNDNSSVSVMSEGIESPTLDCGDGTDEYDCSKTLNMMGGSYRPEIMHGLQKEFNTGNTPTPSDQGRLGEIHDVLSELYNEHPDDERFGTIEGDEFKGFWLVDTPK
jgi:hypothetical protein